MYALPQGPDLRSAVISECGAMNLFFVLGSKQQQQVATSSNSSSGSAQVEVVTPPLDGTILPGITRDSILQLIKE